MDDTVDLQPVDGSPFDSGSRASMPATNQGSSFWSNFNPISSAEAAPLPIHATPGQVAGHNPVLQVDPLAAVGVGQGPGVARTNEPGLRGVGGSPGVAEAPPEAGGPISFEQALINQGRAAAAQAANGRQPLAGLPQEPIKAAGYYTPGPNDAIHTSAEQYMQGAGLPYNPPQTYQKVDPERAGRIAQAYDSMRHNPTDPGTAASYEALIKETMAQYQSLKGAGYKFEFIQPGMKDPYATTPRLAAKDLNENKHLWVFPTSGGFGTEHEISDNPLLGDSGERLNGMPMTYNDVFRIVHDMYGHFKDGNGFRADGEENAWRSHSAMYSDVARPAMTSETRGQNSWVNFGPHGNANRKASAADTVYADQKVGLLPDWAVNEGRYDPVQYNTSSSIPAPGSKDAELAEAIRQLANSPKEQAANEAYQTDINKWAQEMDESPGVPILRNRKDIYKDKEGTNELLNYGE